MVLNGIPFFFNPHRDNFIENGTMINDYIGGVPLRNCPEHDTALGKGDWFPNPTILITYIVTAAICFFFAILTAAKYNSVRVFNRKIRTNEISNSLWIVFYTVFGARSVFDCVRYGMDVVYDDSDVNAGLFFSSLVLDGLATLFLTLSINHQLKYRSTIKQINKGKGKQSIKELQKEKPKSSPNSDPSLRSKRDSEGPSESTDFVSNLKENLSTSAFAILSIESIYFILFILYLVFLYLDIANANGKDAFYWLFVSAYILQKLPILILTLIVIFSHSAIEGPTKISRNILFFATLTYLAMFCYSSILSGWFLEWADCDGEGGEILPKFESLIFEKNGSPFSFCESECPLYIASWVDLIQWLNILSTILYFAFLKMEYQRNMEECIWATVSQIQDTFDFRRF